jgi:TetR/AcrR family tetracycline transcriptional repressor
MVQAQPTDRLSRERILAAALELTSREGPGALSMRRIAQELDVWPMSLYRYFRDKDELLDALAQSAAEDIGAGSGDGPWRDELAGLLRAARIAFERHPGGARLHRDRRLRESGLAVLARAGLTRTEALDAWDAAMAYAAGAAAVEIAPKRFEYGLRCLLDGIAPTV